MINDQELQDQLDEDRYSEQKYEEHQYQAASNDYSTYWNMYGWLGHRIFIGAGGGLEMPTAYLARTRTYEKN